MNPSLLVTTLASVVLAFWLSETHSLDPFTLLYFLLVGVALGKSWKLGLPLFFLGWWFADRTGQTVIYATCVFTGLASYGTALFLQARFPLSED